MNNNADTRKSVWSEEKKKGKLLEMHEILESVGEVERGSASGQSDSVCLHLKELMGNLKGFALSLKSPFPHLGFIW